VDQLPQRFRVLARWAERANDFRLAHRPDVYLRD
jgi:hypothetical protein